MTRMNVFIALRVSARQNAETWQGASRTALILQALPHIGMGLYQLLPSRHDSGL